MSYSTGAMHAIELARKLEAKGIKCQLFLVDGSPNYLKKIVEVMFPDKNKEDEFQDKLLIAAMSTISAQQIEEV